MIEPIYSAQVYEKFQVLDSTCRIMCPDPMFSQELRGYMLAEALQFVKDNIGEIEDQFGTDFWFHPPYNYGVDKAFFPADERSPMKAQGV